MGGLEDEEPASKRMKILPDKLKGLSNGSSVVEPSGGSSRDLMARPLQSEGDNGDVIGSKGVIKRVEFVRLIANALYSLGYTKTGAYLEEESGIPLHSPVVNVLMQQIHDGKWDESVETLQKIGLSDESVVKAASVLVLEQKFFELLEGDKVTEALQTLRTEITPYHVNERRIRELSSCLVSPSMRARIDSSCQQSAKAKARSQLLEELQKLLPASLMIPEKRLEHLVERALLLQRDACAFHNALNKEMSLYRDHDCGKNQIPSRTLQVLQDHSDEVWFLQFSHNGKYLASSSSDRSAIIWEVGLNGRISLKHRLLGHEQPISLVSWSPDDSQLLTCGVEEAVRRWDVASGACLHVYEKAGLGLVSCGWFPDGKHILAGVTDKSICMWDLDGNELEGWKGQRTLKISDLEITNDGKKIISICRDTAILLLDRELNVDKLIEEDQIITSFQLSRDNKFLLVNLLNQEIHLWNLEGEVEIVTAYTGHKRTRFVIRSCFGGLDQAFIASGSEDSLVYIWQRGTGEVVGALEGHSGSVNCVSWNPANPHMLASASDDHTIRIWGLRGLDLDVVNSKSNEQHSSSSNGNGNGNGVHCSNRGTS
ncbi:WD repeat-containing protein 26 homolog isoform X1 [Cucurbita moschata]|uniref:WD repeat-containing protein 26 homolog isoform X1 n=3 Tax=Cucurbita TaxID=3660 RepID=A0A6J1F5R9_CUCMO